MPSDWIISPAGDWHGLYGSRGVWVAGIPDSGYPAGMPRVPMILTNGVNLTFAPDSIKPFALAKPFGLGRIEAIYYNGNNPIDNRRFSVQLDIPNEPALVRFYCYDRYGGSTRQRAIVRTLSGDLISDGFILTDFAAGIYAGLQVSGPCVVTWEGVAGYLVQMSGIFIDPPTGPPPDNLAPVLVTGQVFASGTLFTATFSEPVQGESGLILSGQAGGGTVAEEPIYIIPTVLESRTETSMTFRVTRARPIFRGERVALTYQTGDIRDLAGNQMVPFSGVTVQNDSSMPAPVWQAVARAVMAQSNVAGVRTCQIIEMLLWPEG